MGEAAHTGGPWEVRAARRRYPSTVNGAQIWAGDLHVASLTNKADKPIDQKAADGRLIAAAPDHALVGWAMCVQDARWDEWGSGKGEFCFAGLRHSTTLDEFGVPVLTTHLRSLLVAARAAQPQPKEGKEP